MHVIITIKWEVDSFDNKSNGSTRKFIYAIYYFRTDELVSGSNLIDNPDEWKYSAKFTNYFKGTVSNYQDIYQIDFFIYAAKFYPTAFIVMLVSLLYMLILILYILFKRKDPAI